MSPPLLEHDYMGRSGALSTEASSPDLRETELRLGLPGSVSPERKQLTLELLPPSAKGKRGFSELKKDGGASGDKLGPQRKDDNCIKGKLEEKKKPAGAAPAAKTQVVGWPPIRSYRKNTMAINPSKNKEDAAEAKQGGRCLYVKVSLDGAPYLRKVDLQTYKNYRDLSTALEKLFSGFTSGKCDSNESAHVGPTDLLNGSEFVLTYEDKDGDWMLVGDVPWEMFAASCRRLRIMKGSDAIGLAPRAEKGKSRN
ncbi:auxin-responsive protein IAA21-like protein [Carex littledalei]|uniref:Auxin-responsive protein n=1 Tax=Carex littledalei TaxID=544730 RepID=A0A833VBY7_9POAL|nr:auxin-responsive protein IAA21-like protein [Carex littledalei]